MLMATQTSLSAGRAAGIAVGAGLGLMAAIWTMMALLGFGVIFDLFPFLYVGAKAVEPLIFFTSRTGCGGAPACLPRPSPSRPSANSPQPVACSILSACVTRECEMSHTTNSCQNSSLELPDGDPTF